MRDAFQRRRLPSGPKKRLRGCPPQLADFVRQTLQWQPHERLTAASASLHSFLSSRALSVTVAVAQGKHGLGSIAQGTVDYEVMEYLQKCPTWEQWHAECRRSKFYPNQRISREECHLRVNYIGANNTSKRTGLNNDANLPLIEFERPAL